MRSQLLSSNIANADTPNYKARDIDFAAALKNAHSGQLTLRRTSELHMSGRNENNGGAEIKYRIPTQPSLDGNTVQADVEQAAFAENAVQYRTSLAFLDGRIRGLRYAIKGAD